MLEIGVVAQAVNAVTRAAPKIWQKRARTLARADGSFIGFTNNLFLILFVFVCGRSGYTESHGNITNTPKAAQDYWEHRGAGHQQVRQCPT